MSQLGCILEELLLMGRKAILEGEMSSFRELTGGRSGLRSASGYGTHIPRGPSLYLMLKAR